MAGGSPGGVPSRRDPFDLPDVSGIVVGVIGGTGEQGRGLATRWSHGGLEVAIGSRSPDRAAKVAAQMGATVRGLGNGDCARAADVVVVAVPWDGHAEMLADLAHDMAGKIVVDCVNPLIFDKRGACAAVVPEGSAAQQAAEILPESRVVGAFHHVSAALLLDPEVPEVDCDVLVVGDDREATDVVQALAGLIPGMRGIYAGPLRNARQVESLTANLISINRRYRSHAGIRVTDV